MLRYVGLVGLGDESLGILKNSMSCCQHWASQGAIK